MSKEIQKNNIILILGKIGCGKTTLTKNIIKKVKDKNIIIFDILNEYPEYKGFNFYNITDFFNYNENKRYIPFINPFVEAEMLCDYALLYGNSLLVLEETDVVYRLQNPESLTRLLHLSRHKNVDVIMIARRPYYIPRLITSLASVIYVGKIQEERDIQYLQDFGFSESELRKIKDYHFIKKNL